ncbi:hypothetical protein JL722_14695 [Aureococcus anophagefferens]|nr:hypothetical protein JL722_14695 [Aureococcus anophagefferens]
MAHPLLRWRLLLLPAVAAGQYGFIQGGSTCGTVVTYTSSWYNVCDDYWDIVDAHVFCRDAYGGVSAGSPSGSWNWYAYHVYSQLTDGWYGMGYDDIQCTGSEAYLYLCAGTTAHAEGRTDAPADARALDGRADGLLPRRLGHRRRFDLRRQRRLRAHLGLPRRRERVRDARRLRRGRRRTVVATTTTDNDGSLETTVAGDAEVNAYTLTLACADDPSLTDAVAFQVSFTPAPTASPAPTAYAMASSLVAHYSFDDGTAADDSGAGLDGFVSGATATTGLDQRGALAFDGSGQYAARARCTAGDGSGAYALSGKLDEVYVYASALDGDAVAWVYNAMKAPTQQPTYLREPSLVGHYAFSGGARRRPRGLDGTVVGAVEGEPRRLARAPLRRRRRLRDGALARRGAAASRSVCLWAALDAFNGGAVFRDASTGFGLATTATAGTVEVTSASGASAAYRPTARRRVAPRCVSFAERAITGSADYAHSVFAIDVDGGGDVDVLSASYGDNTVAWYENDGSQSFTERVITTLADPYSVYAIDVDSDGDVDVLSASTGVDTVAWYENDGFQSFTERVITNSADAAFSVFALDVDGDGDVDVLSASQDDDTSFTERVITNAADGARSVFAIDVDGDGAVDALSASQTDDTVAWYENDGSESFSERIITTLAYGAYSVFAIDVDSDGDVDVLSAITIYDTVAWYENDCASRAPTAAPSTSPVPSASPAPTAPSPTPEATTFCTSVSFSAAQTVAIADAPNAVVAIDVDGDGDVDVLVSSYADDTIAWHENDGSQSFTERIISDSANQAYKVFAIDVDGDGDVDALSATSEIAGVIAWHENDGQQSFAEHVITDARQYSRTVVAADVDGDGDVDALQATSASDPFVEWYENDGEQSFTGHVITTQATGGFNMVVADVDGDGDLDPLVVGYSDGFAWYENDGAQSFTRRVITQELDTYAVNAADVDGDGDVDGLVATYGQDMVAWFENDGAQSFTERVVTTLMDGAYGVYPTDADGDGDVDLLAIAHAGAKVAWYKNDGSGTFEEIDVDDRDKPRAPAAADVDGDGDADFLVAFATLDDVVWYENDCATSAPTPAPRPTAPTPAPTATSEPTTAARASSCGLLHERRGDDTVAWFENDGSQSFTARVITALADDPRSVYALDVDGDGDVDALSAIAVDDKVAWYENDGFQSFTERVLTTLADAAYSVYAVDVDGDGDVDALSASADDDTVAWYENDGSQSFAERIITTLADRAWSVFAIDVDGDGDVDALSASYNDDTVAWYENDGSQSFTEHVLTTLANGACSVFAIDVDGDGDVDLLSASYQADTVAWYENDGSQSFTEHIITDSAAGARSVFAIDVDGDGDVDALEASYSDDTVAWYENDCDPARRPRRPRRGDARARTRVAELLAQRRAQHYAQRVAQRDAQHPPSARPSAFPSFAPTAAFVHIESVGTLFTCVSNVECDVVWTYRGSLDACATVTFTVYDATGAEVASEEVANGEGGASASIVTPGDAVLETYAIAVACVGHAVSHTVDFVVSATLAPTAPPTTFSPSRAPTLAPAPAPRAPTLAPSLARRARRPRRLRGPRGVSRGMDAETAESLASVFESAIASVAGVDADSVGDLTFSSGRRRLDDASSVGVGYALSVDSRDEAEEAASTMGDADTSSMTEALIVALAPAPATAAPTGAFLAISAMGVESTCVHDVACEVTWVYRGDAAACATLDVSVADVDGNVVATTTTANDGSQMTTVSGDAEINEYTLALACADDPSLADAVAFRVSFTPAPTRAEPPPDERRADARADGAVLEITAVGTLATCVSGVDCYVRWDYVGAAAACRTVDVAIADADGTVVVSGTADNDGELTSVVRGDAEVSAYTMTLACADDAAVSSSFDFQDRCDCERPNNASSAAAAPPDPPLVPSPHDRRRRRARSDAAGALSIRVNAIATSCDGRPAASRAVAIAFSLDYAVFTDGSAFGTATVNSAFDLEPTGLASTSSDQRYFKLPAYSLAAATTGWPWRRRGGGSNVTSACASTSPGRARSTRDSYDEDVDGFYGEDAGLAFAWTCASFACDALLEGLRHEPALELDGLDLGDGGAAGAASITFYVAKPPSAGRVFATPGAGYALETEFDLETTGEAVCQTAVAAAGAAAGDADLTATMVDAVGSVAADVDADASLVEQTSSALASVASNGTGLEPSAASSALDAVGALAGSSTGVGITEAAAAGLGDTLSSLLDSPSSPPRARRRGAGASTRAPRPRATRSGRPSTAF